MGHPSSLKLHRTSVVRAKRKEHIDGSFLLSPHFKGVLTQRTHLKRLCLRRSAANNKVFDGFYWLLDTEKGFNGHNGLNGQQA